MALRRIVEALRRRSLTARRRSAKPQKRVRLPPAPLSVCPVVPLSWFTRTDRSRARGRRRRSPRTPGTHTPVNQTMPDARRSDTPTRFRVASGPIVARSAFMSQHWFAAERPSPSARERVVQSTLSPASHASITCSVVAASSVENSKGVVRRRGSPGPGRTASSFESL